MVNIKDLGLVNVLLDEISYQNIDVSYKTRPHKIHIH